MSSPTERLHPIIYVRGYAGSQSEVEETVATPFMGFNLGSTKIRQTWTGDTRLHMFESPLVRLMKDYGYRDVYSHGDVMAEDEPMPQRSVVIYRYYDQVSTSLGDGERPEIETYARGLNALIERVRKQVCLGGKVQPQDFKVYLVAHSMGGLVCRSFL
ncbi:MAG: esterase/lipase family protein, partial [Planctomycetota bacterium]